MTKSQLLREKASRLTAGPERAALLEKADELAKRAGISQ